jgi:plasmid stabilization system protein ParE
MPVKLSPEAEDEIDRLYRIYGDAWAGFARAAMTWAYRDAVAICRGIADGPEYGADGEMFKDEDDPAALACAKAIEERACVKP